MKKAILIFGGLGLLGFGLYRYFKTQADLLKQFTWKISGFKIGKITLNEFAIDLTFLFSSSADIEAQINKLYLDLYIDGKNVGFVSEEQAFIIPAKGSTNIPVHVSINPQEVFKNIVDLLLGSFKNRDVKFKLSGYVSLKSGFVSTTIPINYETSIQEYLKDVPLVK
jgi:LEA14-like dessication related protein